MPEERIESGICVDTPAFEEMPMGFGILVEQKSTLMLRNILLTLSVILSGFSSWAGNEKPILVSAQWLKEHLNDKNIVLLHVSFIKFDYDKEHIEGAHHLWPESLAPNTPYANYNSPDVAEATSLLRSFGINNDTHIILYHVRGEVSPTARMFLTLEHLGLKGNISFLNGGLDAWKKEGYPVTSEIRNVKAGSVVLKPVNLLVDKDYVMKTLNSDGGVVVDARTKNFYDGAATGNPRDGHISGAQNIPYPELIDPSNMFKPVEQLNEYFSPVADKNKELVVYCFIGQTASVVYMAGRMLGYKMKLYDGSMQEWSRFDELPMEKSGQ